MSSLTHPFSILDDSSDLIDGWSVLLGIWLILIQRAAFIRSDKISSDLGVRSGSCWPLQLPTCESPPARHSDAHLPGCPYWPTELFLLMQIHVKWHMGKQTLNDLSQHVFRSRLDDSITGHVGHMVSPVSEFNTRRYVNSSVGHVWSHCKNRPLRNESKILI